MLKSNSRHNVFLYGEIKYWKQRILFITQSYVIWNKQFNKNIQIILYQFSKLFKIIMPEYSTLNLLVYTLVSSYILESFNDIIVSNLWSRNNFV
jgi:hypothetical protein